MMMNWAGLSSGQWLLCTETKVAHGADTWGARDPQCRISEHREHRGLSYLWPCSGHCPVLGESSWLLSWDIASFSAAAIGQPERLFKKKKVGRSELKRECNLLGHLPHSSLACTKCCRNNINSSLSHYHPKRSQRALQTTVSTFVTKPHLRGDRKQTHLKIKILCKGDITIIWKLGDILSINRMHSSNGNCPVIANFMI